MDTKLKLTIGRKNGKSVVTERFFTSPLKLGLPKSGEDRISIILMMASAGILKGDAFDYEIRCESLTRSRITEQSYAKIFDTGDGKAKKKQHIKIADNASLYYRPSPVIPFENSTFDAKMLVELKNSSEFAWADILTAGRIAMKERFAFRHYRSRVCVCLDEKPVWMDHCFLEPQRMDTDGMLFFDGHTHQGTFYYYGTAEQQKRILDWRQTFAENSKNAVRIGISEALQGICVRVLADTAQDIEEIFDTLARLLELT